LSDWYSVSSREFKDFGGAALLRRTRKTLPQLISSLYPDFEWDQNWISGGRAPGAKPTRRNKAKLLAALEKAEKQLGITQARSLANIFASILLTIDVNSPKIGTQ